MDPSEIDDAVLALLGLGLHDGARARKGSDRDAMDRLHRAGLISEPRTAAKSVAFTEAGPPTPKKRTAPAAGGPD